jgi:hypothetical protein
MSIKSLKNKTKRGNLLVGNDPFIPSDYESIATVTVGSGGAANVEFTSIPATYTHLQIRMIAKNSSTSSGYDFVNMQFNSDTGSNYNSHYLEGTGSGSPISGGVANSVSIYAGDCARSNASYANMFAASIIDILDYANTNKYTTVRTLAGLDYNGSGGVDFQSGAWRNTNAVTSIKFSVSGVDIAQYSHFALYGIKGA